MVRKTGTERAADTQASSTITAAKIACVAVIVAALIAGAFAWLNNSSSPKTGVENKDSLQQENSEGQNIQIGDAPNSNINIYQGSASPKKNPQTTPPERPPENIPTRESFGIPLLTDNDRDSPNYKMSIVEIHNSSDVPIKVAYSVEANPESLPASSVSKLNHILTEEILPGEILEDDRKYFGGPVHLSVHSNGKWFPSNNWFDMKVIAKRVLLISKEKESFSFHLNLGENQ